MTRFGMSAKLGPRVFGDGGSEPFVGRSMTATPKVSGAVAAEIDAEIGRIVDAAYARARTVLTEHRGALTRLAQALLEHETIERAEFVALLDDSAEGEIRGRWAPGRTRVHA